MKKKKNVLFAVGCVALALMLTFSTYISLVVFGVITEENLKGSQGNTVTSNVGAGGASQGEGSAEVSGQSNPILGDIGSNNNPVAPNQQGSSGGNEQAEGQISAEEYDNIANTTSAKSNYYLDTGKSAKEVIDIYADIMNKTKALKPGFTKIEYQDLPGDPENRVVTEGADSIETVFGFIESLGLIVDKDTAYKEPFIHEKGEEMVTSFPVFGREKGSYLTDPKGVKSYTYEKLKNGNIKLTFTLVEENNPEPIGENSNVAPSYTGAVFAPMSKKTIDDTINHPIVKAFSKDIKYNLVYHDCKVEMVFNPQTEHIVSLNHFANVILSGTGDVVIGGKMVLEKQELETVVLIKDFNY